DRRVNRSRTAFACGAVVLSLLAAGCSGDPKPRVAPEPSPSSTSPTAIGPVEPVMPEAAKAHTPAGAEAFVKYYWQWVNYAQRTGVVDRLRALGPGCDGCEGGISFIEGVYSKGGRIRGGDGLVGSFHTGLVSPSGEHRAVVDCDVTSTKQVADFPGTSSDKHFPGGRTPFEFVLATSADGWTVVSLVSRT
ncbi:MAG: DUF6318 family protein, partial [Nocardioidaceae bacterium]